MRNHPEDLSLINEHMNKFLDVLKARNVQLKTELKNQKNTFRKSKEEKDK